MSTAPAKTYEQLQQEAADRWKDAANSHASRMRTTQEQIANSPDVLNAPLIGSQWANELVRCPCGGHVYTTMRYSCVNGIKHRTEVLCVTCRQRSTWDFGLNTWL